MRLRINKVILKVEFWFEPTSANVVDVTKEENTGNFLFGSMQVPMVCKGFMLKNKNIF